MELTVIVPARNEEDCLGACLESLVAQSDEIFELGKDWELMVVDDHSTDRTAEIARGFAGVTVLEAGKLEARLDGQGQCRVDGGQAGARAVAAVYRCGHDSRAGEPASRHPRGQATQSGDAELLAAADCERAGAAVADAAGVLRTGAGLSAGQGFGPEPADCRSQRAVSAGGAGGVPAAGRTPERGGQGAGGRGTGVSGQAAEGGAAFSLCGRCGVDAHVPQHEQ